MEKIFVKLKDTLLNLQYFGNISIIDSNNLKLLVVKSWDSSSTYYKMIQTNDGGNSWNINNTDTNTFNGAQSMLFVNKDIGYIVCGQQIAKFSSTMRCVIYRTSDGGKNWKRVLDTLNGKNQSGLHCIVFGDSLNGMAMGRWGSMWRTTDGGIHWFYDPNEVNGHVNDEFIDLAMPTPNIIYGIDSWAGKIFKYDANIYTSVPQLKDINDDMIIFPNPIYTGNDINIKINLLLQENIKFILINSLGNIIDYSEVFFLNSGSHTIKINPKTNLPDGVYCLKIIRNGNGVTNKLFVILK